MFPNVAQKDAAQENALPKNMPIIIGNNADEAYRINFGPPADATMQEGGSNVQNANAYAPQQGNDPMPPMAYYNNTEHVQRRGDVFMGAKGNLQKKWVEPGTHLIHF